MAGIWTQATFGNLAVVEQGKVGVEIVAYVMEVQLTMTIGIIRLS